MEYDEFGLFHENAAEYGLPFDRPPDVRRVFADVGEGRRLSALAWQDRDPELVLLHGGAQNAHTWDTVAMAPAPAPDSPALASPGTGTRYEQLWEALSSVTTPVLLARGMRPDSVLDDDDERELRQRLPSAQVVHVEGAGHSLQGDTPLELTAIIEQFVFGELALQPVLLLEDEVEDHAG